MEGDRVSAVCACEHSQPLSVDHFLNPCNSPPFQQQAPANTVPDTAGNFGERPTIRIDCRAVYPGQPPTAPSGTSGSATASSTPAQTPQVNPYAAAPHAWIGAAAAVRRMCRCDIAPVARDRRMTQDDGPCKPSHPPHSYAESFPAWLQANPAYAAWQQQQQQQPQQPQAQPGPRSS